MTNILMGLSYLLVLAMARLPRFPTRQLVVSSVARANLLKGIIRQEFGEHACVADLSFGANRIASAPRKREPAGNRTAALPSVIAGRGGAPRGWRRSFGGAGRAASPALCGSSSACGIGRAAPPKSARHAAWHGRRARCASSALRLAAWRAGACLLAWPFGFDHWCSLRAHWAARWHLLDCLVSESSGNRAIWASATNAPREARTPDLEVNSLTL